MEKTNGQNDYVSAHLLLLKKLLAEFLVRKKADYTIDFSILGAFLDDFRWEYPVSPNVVAANWRRYFQTKYSDDVALCVYIHIPFCAKKCFFCHCAMSVTTERGKISRYVEELVSEIKFFSSAWQGRSVQLVQIGGGTPSLLSTEQLRESLNALFSSFKIDMGGIRSIEFNPASASLEKMKVARAFEFNRISFGVQSLNSSALKKEKREYQDLEMTRCAISWARDAGFEIINADLLLGLTYDNEEGFLESFQSVAELKPDSIVVSSLVSTDAYLKVMKRTRERHHLHCESMTSRVLEKMRHLCGNLGYRADGISEASSEWTIYRRDLSDSIIRTMSSYYENAHIPVMGLGHYARSFIPGDGIYERVPKLFAVEQPLYRAATLNEKEEMMRYVIHKIKNDSKIDFVSFKDKFGIDFLEVFNLELRSLQMMGKIKIDKGCVEFVPVRGPERIFYGLFFLIDALSRPPLAVRDWPQSWRESLDEELSMVRLK